MNHTHCLPLLTSRDLDADQRKIYNHEVAAAFNKLYLGDPLASVPRGMERRLGLWRP